MSLKLGPIPERAPIKLNISLARPVHEALVDYARYQDMRHVSWGDLRTKSLNCFRKTSESLRETLLSLSPAGELS